MKSDEWTKIEKLLEEIADYQKKKLMECGRRIIPHLTSDDLLQPNDFAELENHPYFRYEEGVLAGVQTIQVALQALRKEN